MDKTIKELSILYPNIKIEYSSSDDWISSDWVIVEQFINEWLFSKYIDKNRFLFTDNEWNSYVSNYNDIFENEDTGLILDTIHSKIYLNWEKLTSKDIKSQNTTIEILLLLLDNIGIEVSNKELSASSYSKNKNEMVWKIILPFIKFIENKTKVKLPLECRWSICDYNLKLDKISFKIWTITRI